MAIIQTIRNKYAKAAGAAIVVALVGFVLMDFGKGGFSRSSTAAEVNGTSIDIQDFNNRTSVREQQIRSQNPQAEINETQSAQIKEEVWNEMVSEALTGNLYETLGIQVSDKEVRDMFSGPMPDPLVVQQLTNPQTGKYDPVAAAQQYKQLEKEKSPTKRQPWEQFKQQLIKNRLTDKLGTMVYAAANMPKAILDMQNNMNQTVANVSMVQVPYTLVNDDKVKVEEAEIKKYMQDRSNLFANKTNTRSIEYVIFPMVPSTQDTIAHVAQMDSLKAGFIAATDAESYARKHSMENVAVIPATTKALQGIPNAQEIANATTGSVVGPFVIGKNDYLGKVFNKTLDSGSVSVRHILVMTKQGTEQVKEDAVARALIDSVARLAASGRNFDELARTFSDDPGSKENGGKYDFGPNGREGLTKEFGDFAYEGKVGEKKIVQVNSEGYSGYHYIEILPVKPVKSVVFIAVNYTPSTATQQAINTKATQFANDAATGPQEFDKKALALGMQKQTIDNIDPNSELIGSLGASAAIVKWASAAEINDVSPIYSVNGDYVVAKLKSINKKGDFNMSKQAKDYVTNELRRQKKYKMLAKEYDNKASLEEIASASGQTIVNADTVTFRSSNKGNLNSEPLVLGYAINNVKQGEKSSGINGFQGVYYIKVNNKQAPTSKENTNLEIQRKLASAQLKAQGYQQFVNAIRNKAEISDKRASFLRSN